MFLWEFLALLEGWESLWGGGTAELPPALQMDRRAGAGFSLGLTIGCALMQGQGWDFLLELVCFEPRCFWSSHHVWGENKILNVKGYWAQWVSTNCRFSPLLCRCSCMAPEEPRSLKQGGMVSVGRWRLLPWTPLAELLFERLQAVLVTPKYGWKIKAG